MIQSIQCARVIKYLKQSSTTSCTAIFILYIELQLLSDICALNQNILEENLLKVLLMEQKNSL